MRLITMTNMIFVISLIIASVHALGETCTHAIDRLKAGPQAYADIVKKGNRYEDDVFNGRETLYWLAYEEFSKLRDYENNLFWGNMSF